MRIVGWSIECLIVLILGSVVFGRVGERTVSGAERGLRIGMSETDITPPVGFPMAGYFHERLATGQLDPLKAKSIVFRDHDRQGAIVICDLTGVAADLTAEVRRRAAQRTGIPEQQIAVCATHSHTAPDYYKTLFDYVNGVRDDPTRSAYIDKLIDGIVEAIVLAHTRADEVQLAAGYVVQRQPVSFNRRFVMRDGSVRTWMSLDQPNVLRAAGPIDPQIGVVAVKKDERQSIGVFTNFALHLDTVGGLQWSGDYPYHLEQRLRQALGNDLISIFGTGCCGDINHVNPSSADRNSAEAIGNALSESLLPGMNELRPVRDTRLEIRTSVVRLPLQEVSQAEIEHASAIMGRVAKSESVEFLDHVSARKRLLVDWLRHETPLVEQLTDGAGSAKVARVSQTLAGSGETLPVDVQAFCIGEDVAIVCLPGEVFVDLGLAIKQASPFRVTLIVELSNVVETCYIPTRAAYAGGSYEVTNSAVRPGAGEMLVEATLQLLRDARSAMMSNE